jgi:hypothetical protein
MEFAGQDCIYCAECDTCFLPDGSYAYATVTFKNEDGSVINTQEYKYNDNVVVPKKDSDNTYNYTLHSDKAIETVCKGNAEYIIKFVPEYIDYSVTFKDYDGTVISENTYHYGDTVIAPDDPVRNSGNTHTYIFTGWGKEVVDCIGNATYTATYTMYHDFEEEWTIDKSATCTTNGSKSHHCTSCNEKADVTVIDALGHNWEAEWTIDSSATCTTNGSKSHHCTSCNGKSDVTVIDALGHNWEAEWIIDKAATCTAGGSKSHHCTRCDAKTSVTTIPKISSVKLSATEYTYNGYVKKPTVTIKDVNGNKLESGVDYTVSYASGRKLPGKYKVTITFKGEYSGTKSLYFTITPKAPAKFTVASRSTSTIKLSWPKAEGVTGYRIYRYDSSTGTYKTVATTTNLSYTVKNLKSATNYTFRIKSYKKLSDGTTLWSGYRALTAATRPVAPLINSLTSSSKGKVTLKWTNVARESGYQIYYSTSKTGTYKLLDTTKVNDVSETCGGLTSGKTYYFKVRAFKTVNGNRIYSSFSPAKGIKIK